MNVLVVEDSRMLRRAIVRRLNDTGEFRVVGESESESDALNKAQGLVPDIVLLDLSLAAGGSGYKVLKTLRQASYPGKIVVVSSEYAHAKACMQAGADGFYDKASGLETLFDDLTSLAQNKPQITDRETWPTHHRLAPGTAGAPDAGGAH